MLSIFSCVCLGSSLYSLIILWSLLSIAILDFTILITKITKLDPDIGEVLKHMKFFLWDFLNCRDLGLWVVLKCKEKESEQGQWAGRRVTDAT